MGWSSIAMATAYPGVVVDGFDPDETSVEVARRNAEAARVSNRVRLHAKDAAAERHKVWANLTGPTWVPPTRFAAQTERAERTSDLLGAP
jgi:predicted O-methyltransferase YrrM